MKETQILFKPEMIRAILAGTKTQTRRLIKPQPDEDGLSHIKELPGNNGDWFDTNERRYVCHYGRKGDLLWVRETWAVHPRFKTVLYRADGEEFKDAPGYGLWKPSWKPSIHMPKWACRLWLELTADPEPQRLQEITANDCYLEGIDKSVHEDAAKTVFFALWDSITGPGSWESNPWVWKLEFKRVEP